jgi:hypothetical protein
MPPLTRRRALAVLFAAGVSAAGTAGCRAGGTAPAGPSAGPPERTGPTGSTERDPLLAVLDAEFRLLAAYDATARTHPALAGRLAPMRADHVEHAAALQRALEGAGSGSSGPERPAPPVPSSRAGALAALRAAEHAAAATRARAAETAPTDRAVLLASIAACEASHEVLLQ